MFRLPRKFIVLLKICKTRFNRNKSVEDLVKIETIFVIIFPALNLSMPNL